MRVEFLDFFGIGLMKWSPISAWHNIARLKWETENLSPAGLYPLRGRGARPMVMEGNEIANGWPLGIIGNSTNSRMVIDTSHQAAAPPRPRNHASQLHRCSSFSSFSSSNLDTESTASFFPDQSVSLGRLIGIRASNKGRLYCEQDRNVRNGRSHHPAVPKPHTHNSQGLCVPLLHHVIARMSSTRTQTRPTSTPQYHI
ncbi:hypothetical protein Salat_0332400 [Sesamum alatum]|uniref:Uncharacterized protein n=1 Tax=Sesamum alatum TaxID=300844 RepID=A0AAE1Z0C7_9LAMI|nr:hypothetical protein Salat_0332400 [Sesamum alatum]